MMLDGAVHFDWIVRAVLELMRIACGIAYPSIMTRPILHGTKLLSLKESQIAAQVEALQPPEALVRVPG